MPKRACVFVDGENFRYSIVNLFKDKFDQRDYLPKQADWGRLFDWIVSEAVPQAERIRTYWYVIEKQDFFPYKFPDPEKDPDTLKKVLCKNNSLAKKLSTLTGDGLIKEMKQAVENMRELQIKQRKRFDGWQVLQDVVSSKYPRIEFRRAGAITFNLFEKKFGKEKAVDVKLATDLIMLRDIYDVAVIVSGDQDYVPAVQVVKDSGKHVVNVAFLTRSGKLLPGGARRLNQIVDWSLEIKYADLDKYLSIKPIAPTLFKSESQRP